MILPPAECTGSKTAGVTQHRFAMLPKLLVGAILTVVTVPGLVQAGDLQTGTLSAWDDYIKSASSRMQDRVDGTQPFLWMDESTDRRLRVRRGEILIAPLVSHGTQAVPNGMIHHWIGATFLAGATIEALKSVVEDYDAYHETYKPAVIASKALGCTATDREFSMTWQRHVLFINAAIQGQYRSHEVMLNERRGYDVTGTMRVQEIEDYGRPGERLLPPDTGSGFIWRLHSIARYEERDGGVYLELEAFALTRDIPPSLRWLVTPVVNRLSINSLTMTLQQTRRAVTAPPRPRFAGACRGRDSSVALAKSSGAE
jgi:hypothetical protein